jgi:hypothetical protein
MDAAYAVHLIKHHPFEVTVGTFLNVNEAPPGANEMQQYDRMPALLREGPTTPN